MPAAMNKQRIEIKPNTQLTDTDKAFIMLNYFRKDPPADEPSWSLAKALTVAGVSQDEQKIFLEQQDSPESIREMFTRGRTSNMRVHNHSMHLPLPNMPKLAITSRRHIPIPMDFWMI